MFNRLIRLSFFIASALSFGVQAQQLVPIAVGDITIFIPIGEAPVANNDHYSISERQDCKANTPNTIGHLQANCRYDLGNIFANDTDVDGAIENLRLSQFNGATANQTPNALDNTGDLFYTTSGGFVLLSETGDLTYVAGNNVFNVGVDSFQYTVSDNNGSGLESELATVSISVTTPDTPAIPQAPVSFNASPSRVPANTSFTLTWSQPAGATYYNLYQTAPEGVESFVGQMNTNTSTRILSAVGEHLYRVDACNVTGCSEAKTTVVSVYSASGSVPGKPSNFASNPSRTVSGGSFTLSWSRPSSATYFNLYATPPGGTQRFLERLDGTSSSRNAHINGAYRYHVSACNASGCSEQENLLHDVYASGSASVTDTQWSKKNGAVADATLTAPTVPASNFNGVMAGSGGVSGGAASYSIPVSMPPGRAGIQPSVSLSYSSRSGNGIAGVGWSLNAGGAISRCPATQAQDGFTSGIWFKNATDRLCMNGQRLVVESGTYGAINAVYRTEIDSFAKVTQLGGGLTSSTAYFEVEYANGEVSTYGKTASTRVSPTGETQTLSWLMERMEDASGRNHMTYKYTDEGDGEVLLDEILYTGDGGTADGNRSVRFTYENRTKFSTSYIAGAYTRQTKRLSKIASYYIENKVWEYDLDYAASTASNRSLLQSVQECGYQGTTKLCRDKATFDWLDKAPTYQVEPLSTSNGKQLVSRNHLNQMRDSWEVTARGDADGNGSRDWPEYYTNAEGDDLGINTTELDACSPNRITRQPTCFAADFNFDGRTDSWRFTNVGTSYVLQLSHANDAGTLSWFSSGVSFPNGDREVEALTSIADYTGDGWPDIIIHQGFDGPESGFKGTLWLYPHSRGAVPYSDATRISLLRTNEHDSFQFVGDMNSDGLPDIVRNYLNADTALAATPTMSSLLLTKVASLNSGVSVTFESHNIEFGAGLITAEGREQFAMLIDVNGDGLQDWVGWIVGGQGKLHVKLNKGDGTFAVAVNTEVSLPTRTLFLRPEEGIGGFGTFAQGQTQSPRFSEALKPMDIDGDGRAELIMPGNAATDIVSEACWTHPSGTGTGVTNITRCGRNVYDTYNSNGPDFGVIIENAPASWDHNIYKYKAIRFTEDVEGVITAAVENTDLIGAATHSSVQDAFGKGLADLVFTFGCTSDHCSMEDDNLQNDSDLPVNHYLFNRNYGATEDATLNKDSYRPIDMMVKVTNGAGLESQWAYHPLSSDQVTDYYDADYSIIDGEHFNFASTMYNVSQFEQSNGVGSTNTMSYQYRGAMYNAFGRGFRGFRTIIEIDDTRGTHTQTDFKQVFPYSSLIERQRRYAGDQILSDTQNTWAENTSHDIDGVVNVFNSGSTTTQYDLNSGVQVGNSSSAVAQANVDAYGNVSEQTQTATDEYGTLTTVTTTVFDPQDTSSVWWPHRQTSTTVARTIAHTIANPARHAGATVNKTITTRIAKWNDTHRQPEIVTIAPGIAALTAAQCNAETPVLNACQTTTTTYNTYGLPTTITVKGTKITGTGDTPSTETRTTTTSYSDNGTVASAKGYFPFQVGQSTGSRTLTQTIETFPKTGLQSKVTDASGVVTTTHYDLLARPVDIKVTGIPKQFIRYRTPDSNAPTGLGADAIMMVETHQAGTPVNAEYIDRLGRSIRARSQDFAGSSVYTDSRYDNLGRMTHESNQHYGSPVYTTYDSYDVLDRPLSKTTRATQSGEDVETRYVHDVLETTITTQTADGADLTLKRSYSTQGQLMSTTDALGGVTSYAYDAAGNPVVIKDAVGNSIYANYDDLGRKEWVIDPNQGRTDFVYNDFGDLDKETDANSDTTRYEHDHLGRVLSRFGDNQKTATFVWDTRKAGLMTSESADSVTKSYAYDSASRPTAVTTTIDGAVYTTTTQYDANYGRPKAMVYPNDLTVKLEYNTRGYLNKESNAQSDYVYREITAQDAWGNISSAKLTDGLLTSTMLYSTRTNQMLSSRVQQGNVDKHYLNYSNYDSYGNIITQQNLANGVNASETFTYDELHRLTQSSLSGNGFTNTIDYGFDGVGNLTKKTDYSADEANAYKYTTGTNRLSTVKLKDNSTATFGYDAKGNLTKRNNVTENTYNVFNKPTRIQRLGSTVNLNYGADLARYKQVRTVNGQTITTHYIDKVFEVETTGSGTSKTTKETTYIADVALLIEDKDSTGELTDTQIRFGHKDRLGSTATFTDHNGQVTTLRSYDPFGKPKGGDWSPLSNLGLSARLYNNVADSDMPTRRGYTDHEHLDEVEIIHMNGRVYDYNVGRFMSVDPLIQDPGNSQSINPYSYVMNNPLGFNDPSGYCGSRVEGGGGVCHSTEFSGGSAVVERPDAAPMSNGAPQGFGDSGAGGGSGMGTGSFIADNTEVMGQATVTENSAWTDQDGNPTSPPAGFNGTETAGVGVAGGLGAGGTGVLGAGGALGANGGVSGEGGFNPAFGTSGRGSRSDARPTSRPTSRSGEGDEEEGEYLYHYTNSEENIESIILTQTLRASQGTRNARYGTGQYFTDVRPEEIGARTVSGLTDNDIALGRISKGQAARILFGDSRKSSSLNFYIKVNVKGLRIQNPREHVFFHSNFESLDLRGRIVGFGPTLGGEPGG